MQKCVAKVAIDASEYCARNRATGVATGEGGREGGGGCGQRCDGGEKNCKTLFQSRRLIATSRHGGSRRLICRDNARRSLPMEVESPSRQRNFLFPFFIYHVSLTSENNLRRCVKMLPLPSVSSIGDASQSAVEEKACDHR